MKNKNLLLVIFLLTLFMFQQVQANAQTPSSNKLVNQNSLLPNLYVKMYHLERTGEVVGDRTLCGSGHSVYGCVEVDGVQYYPYDFNIMPLDYDADLSQPSKIIDVESDYLLDVLAHEMDVPNYPNLVPLQAQAVAARSFADYNYRAQGGMINNSWEDQVFVPFAYESYLQNDSQRDLVRQAEKSTTKYYLSDGDSPINATFGSDMAGATNKDGKATLSYLMGVDDPISTICDSINKSGFGA